MDEEIELRHLRHFLAVADALHFTRAAERLRMAQPPLSQSIKRLEERVGHALFERTTRGVRLTLAGQLLVERARGTLEKVQDDLAQVRRLGRGEEGTLTVGFPGSVMFTRMPAAIQSFRARYPRVELRLREMNTALAIGGMLDGTLDMALLRDGDETAGIGLRTVLRERYVAVLPEGHGEAGREVVRLEALAEEPFLLFARRMGPLAYDRTVACCERAGFRPRIVQDVPQWPTALTLVAAGLGVSLAPECVRRVGVDGVVYRAVEDEGWTTVDVAVKVGNEGVLVGNFQGVVEEVMRG